MESCPNCGRTRNLPIGPDLQKCSTCGETWVRGTREVTPAPVLPIAMKAMAAEAWLAGCSYANTRTEGYVPWGVDEHDHALVAFEAWWATRE